MLNDSDNSSLGNVSFKRKIAKIDNFKHSRSWTINDLLKHHRKGFWNVKAVEQRHERLLALLRSRWSVDDIKTKLFNKGPQVALGTTANLHVCCTLQLHSVDHHNEVLMQAVYTDCDVYGAVYNGSRLVQTQA